MINVGDAVAEWFERASGTELETCERTQLAAVLACDEHGWADRDISVSHPSVLDARALAGALVFYETVVMSSSRPAETFRRLSGLIGRTEARRRVRKTSALNGAQRIDLTDGRIRFVGADPQALRGLSADCVVMRDPGAELHHAARITLATSRDAQLVSLG